MKKDTPLYLCNAAKNDTCKKTDCIMHGGRCGLTTKREYAALDNAGNPIGMNLPAKGNDGEVVL